MSMSMVSLVYRVRSMASPFFPLKYPIYQYCSLEYFFKHCLILIFIANFLVYISLSPLAVTAVSCRTSKERRAFFIQALNGLFCSLRWPENVVRTFAATHCCSLFSVCSVLTCRLFCFLVVRDDRHNMI